MTCKDYQRVNSDIEADMDFKQWLNIQFILKHNLLAYIDQ